MVERMVGLSRENPRYNGYRRLYDFVMDLTEDGRRLKMMPVDEHTREYLAIGVERFITAEDVIVTLARLFRQRGAPAFICSDNGPEFVARALKRWLVISEMGTLYIEPHSPWENAYAESFIGRFGGELLKREALAGLVEAKVLVEDYREHHNHPRPHSALGYWMPSEFAASCRSAGVDVGIVKELQSATALSQGLVRISGTGHSKLHIAVMTSRWEGQPHLPLEATWSRVPVVATNVGAISEIIENEMSGLLINSRYADDMARAVMRLTDDLALRESIVVNAHRRVRTIFSETRMLSEIRNKQSLPRDNNIMGVA